MNKNHQALIFTAGFAIFSMFFGSGNLVFPLIVGVKSVDQVFFAVLGLFTTAVCLPFLGLLGIFKYNGNRVDFFSSLGKIPATLLAGTLLLIMGPVGVAPRCIIVAQGGALLVNPEINSQVFNFIFCLASVVIIWQKDRFFPILGKFLTPALLIGILILGVSVYFTPGAANFSELNSWQAFRIGFSEGYLTMDLLAAFFFSSSIFAFIKHSLKKNKETESKLYLKVGLRSGTLGMLLLAIIYTLFAYMGSKFSNQLAEVHPEQLLATISSLALGPYGAMISAWIIGLACLTTFASLVMIASGFFHAELFAGKGPSWLYLLGITSVAYIFSTLSFDELKVWIGALLQILYPALVIYTLTVIIFPKGNKSISRVSLALGLILGFINFFF